MDSIPNMKAGPSLLSAEPNPRRNKFHGTRRATVLLLTFCIFAFGLYFLRNELAGYSIWRWSQQFGENGKPTNKDGDLYLLGVGKADITG